MRASGGREEKRRKKKKKTKPEKNCNHDLSNITAGVTMLRNHLILGRRKA